MSRQRTFEFRGRLVSVVPRRELRRADDPQTAERIARSAEAYGGPALMRAILGFHAPLSATAPRDEWRRCLVKEIRDYSVIWRRPLNEARAFFVPEPIDLRDLVGAHFEDAPTIPTTVPEPGTDAWVGVSIVDRAGDRPLEGLGILSAGTKRIEFDTRTGVDRQGCDRSDTPAVEFTLQISPRDDDSDPDDA